MVVFLDEGIIHLKKKNLYQEAIFYFRNCKTIISGYESITKHLLGQFFTKCRNLSSGSFSVQYTLPSLPPTFAKGTERGRRGEKAEMSVSYLPDPKTRGPPLSFGRPVKVLEPPR